MLINTSENIHAAQCWDQMCIPRQDSEIMHTDHHFITNKKNLQTSVVANMSIKGDVLSVV